MLSAKSRREEQLAAEALHGRPLLLILAALRGQLTAKKAELARERHDDRRRIIEREIAQVEGLIELRKSELDSAIAAAAAEKALT